MYHVGIFEAAYHVYDSVYFTDVGQEFVAQTFAFAGAAHQTSNVNEFDDSRCGFCGVIHFCQFCQSFVRHSYDAHVGVDGTEGIVCCFCFPQSHRVE